MKKAKLLRLYQVNIPKQRWTRFRKLLINLMS